MLTRQEIREILGKGIYAQALRDVLDKDVSVFNAQFFERTFFTAALDGRRLYVAADLVQARDAFNQLRCLEPATVLLPPGEDTLTYKKLAAGTEQPQRLQALHAVATGSAKIVVTCAAALCQRYGDARRFAQDAFALEAGKMYDLAEVRRKLIALGYHRESFPTAAGRFAQRGDILDVWIPGEQAPVRAEFFGDEAESLRTVDPDTCLSGKKLERVEIIPATDVFYDDAQAAQMAAALEIARKEAVGKDGEQRAADIATELRIKLDTGSRDGALKYLAPFFMPNTLLSYGGFDAVIYDDAKQVFDTVAALHSEHKARLAALAGSGEVASFSADAIMPQERVFKCECRQAAFHRLNSSNRIFNPSAVHTFKGMKLPDYSHNFSQLADDLRMWQGGYRVDIYCGTTAAMRNIGDFLEDAKVLSAARLYPDALDRGGIFHDSGRVIIGTSDVTTRRAFRTSRTRRDVFTVPAVGDYVVHATHGIGLCRAVEKLDLTGSARDYLVIEYSGSDKLYVPVENMDSLSKYVAGGEAPKLSKLGGGDFDKLKKRVKQSVKALAFDLLKLYAERNASVGHRYDSDDTLVEEFSADFPYNETEDQIRAINEGLADLKSGKVMDRLLCGDVGYGKTEVALRLAFKVISEGKQAAMLAPTTILACQHFDTAVRRMEKFGVRVERLTRFDSPATVKKTLAALAEGRVDMVCGTHRLLGKDVKFKDLGLLVLDEEQRFGVADKEKLKLLKPNVNVLSMSATPIPRTLYMTMVSVRDVSVLDTPPAERIPVQTFVSEYSDALVRDALSREAGRGGQAFIVYNRVADIDKYAAHLAAVMPNLRFAVAHGQMPENALERTVATFLSGGSDVLIASTIIENGIDMPNANTLIVVDADRLGLSQLYQLRGRVGRSSRMAYAYFTYDNRRILGEAAYKRLEAITEYTEFGSGFKIAMADLEIRGAGNLLGREQHGHMEKVGYDMYCKLLEEAVAELEGKQVKRLREVRLTIDFPACLPAQYVTDEPRRLALYSSIAAVGSLEERQALAAQLTDMYGALPQETENLLDAALIKNLAAEIGASLVKLTARENKVMFVKAIDIAPQASEAARSCSYAVIEASPSPCVKCGSKRDVLKFLLDCHKKQGLNV